jgi:hypothetical protein
MQPLEKGDEFENWVRKPDDALEGEEGDEDGSGDERTIPRSRKYGLGAPPEEPGPPKQE